LISSYNNQTLKIKISTNNYISIIRIPIVTNVPIITFFKYYVQPFHSYEEGNLNWQAALEVLPATYAVSANYWPEEDVFQAESWMRKNTTNSIAEHIFNYERYAPSTYPDTGALLLSLFLASIIIINPSHY
jgi:hypothetical protein